CAWVSRLLSSRGASRLPSPCDMLCLRTSARLFCVAPLCARASFCLASLSRGLRFTFCLPGFTFTRLQAYVFLRSPWFTYSFAFLWLTAPALWVAPDAPVRALGVFFSFFSFWLSICLCA